MTGFTFLRVPGTGNNWRAGVHGGAATAMQHYIIIPADDGLEMALAKRLMNAAAGADRPGARGMSGVENASSRDQEWVLCRVCIHESAHAVVAERYGYKAAIRIERGDQFGDGTCFASGLAAAPGPVRRQVGLAGILGDLWSQHGALLTLEDAVSAVREGPMSESDLHLMQGTASAHEIDICMRRVHSQWDDVINRASELLETELRHYARHPL